MNDFYVYKHAWRYHYAPDCEPELSDVQCKELLKKGGWMVRNTYNFDQIEKTDYWYVIKDSFGGLEELSSNVRRKVRRAFNTFEYKPIGEQIVRDCGYLIMKATVQDDRVKDRVMNEAVFNEYLDSCQKDLHDYWGVFNKETKKLIGFCDIRLWENSCEYGEIAIWPEYKHNATYPYYGLFYKINEYYLGEKKLKYINNSARTVTDHSNIQPFLEHNFKFRKAYCCLKLRYKWWFGIIVRLLYPFKEVIPSVNVKGVLRMHSFRTR